LPCPTAQEGSPRCHRKPCGGLPPQLKLGISTPKGYPMNGQISGNYSVEILKAKLRENRDSHHDQFEKAWQGYCKMVRAELEHKLERIKAGKPIDRYLGHTPPEDHTGDYDDVIAMLEMMLDESIELTQGQFKQYVQDDWGWKEQWVTSNTAYMQS
jgi:hypothetical protein